MNFGQSAPPANVQPATSSLQLPRVLVVSNMCISPAHGTGTLLLRHFSNYPSEKLANVFYLPGGTPSWPNSHRLHVVPSEDAPGGIVGRGVLRVYNSASFRLGLRGFAFNRPFNIDGAALAKLSGFAPGVIFSVGYGEAALAILDQLGAQLPGVPVIQYFLDYDAGAGLSRHRYLGRALRRANEIWALTPEMAEAVSPVAAEAGKTVRVQPGFHLALPGDWKQEHRAAESTGFTCVVSGNFWEATMASLLKRVWGGVQRELPGLGPIRWLCLPEMVKQTTEAAGELSPEIVPEGFFRGEELMARLIAADMAIVPFNASSRPKNNYGRYSLPSRLTELLSVGLPVFCIAGEETPLARYAARHQVAVVCNAQDETRLVQRIVSFIKCRTERAALGAMARKFAGQEFPIQPFQEFFYSKLASLAAKACEARTAPRQGVSA